jgi:spermidine synthase
VICEIEPLATEETAVYFSAANHAVLDDPRVEVIHDDARHFLLSTDEKFDVITSDPIHPWV